MKCAITREVTIKAMHVLAHPELTESQNQDLYGPCARPHGHDYRIRVTLEAEIDARTGVAFDHDRLEHILHVSLIEPFDGTSLNDSFPNTAGEGLARAIFLRLKPLFPDGVLKSVGVMETKKNYFEFPPRALPAP